MRVGGASDRLARRDSGNVAVSVWEKFEAYTVDSRVIRRISHFRRSFVNASGVDVVGG